MAEIRDVHKPGTSDSATSRRCSVAHEIRAHGWLAFGSGVGTLYSATTISGPPMALLFNNQGFVQRDFRAAMALLRVAEAVLALATYYALGLFNAESLELSLWVLPSVLLGVPIGTFLINRVDAETFRRICMSYDAWIVGYGLSRVLVVLQLLASPGAYTIWLGIAGIDSYLLY